MKMNSTKTKTTIEIDPRLLYLVKKKALEQGVSLKHIITTSLEKEVGASPGQKKPKKLTIGGYRHGGIKGTLRRSEIYGDF